MSWALGLCALGWLTIGCSAPQPQAHLDAGPAVGPAGPATQPAAFPDSAPAGSESAASVAAPVGAAQTATASTPAPPPLGLILPEDEPIRAAPRAYLERVAALTRGLEQYTLLFTREERRGLLGLMQPPEVIRCWYRRTPFSVRMLWLTDTVKYGESTFIEGRHSNAVRFVTRWWTPPLLPPPEINRIDLATPVILGESRRPLTDFGLERVLQRTLETLDEVGPEASLRYEGRVAFAGEPPLTHLIRIEIPPRPGKSAVQELLIDPATHLPVGVVLRKRNGAIEGRYLYQELDTTVQLMDDDFLLEVERRPPQTRSAPPAPAAPDPPSPLE